MIYRLAGIIGHEILLGHIGDVITLIVLGQQMIVRLVLLGAVFFGNRLVPFFGIGEFWIDVKNHATKRMLLVADNLTEVIFCARTYHSIAAPIPR